MRPAKRAEAGGIEEGCVCVCILYRVQANPRAQYLPVLREAERATLQQRSGSTASLLCDCVSAFNRVSLR